jgi:RNA polymerase sigma-70 factor (ECF subfamily)
MPAGDRQRPSRFPVTDWSLVGRAGHAALGTKREALGLLMIRYFPALKAHLIHRRGFSPDKADDLLQEFVTSKILEKDLIAHARHDAGKFRTFLLTALDRFVFNCVRDERAKKRSPQEGRMVSIDARADYLESEGEPAEAFHVAWAQNVISQALQRMRQECEVSGRPELWGVFESRIVGPLLHDKEPADYSQLVTRFGFRSPMQASNAVVTAKRMYARVLRAVIGEYADDDEIEVEIDELKSILSRCNS